MSNVSGIIKSIQDIMRKDVGVDGDAQRFDHVGEAAGLREGQAFGCRKKYSQNKLTESAAPR